MSKRRRSEAALLLPAALEAQEVVAACIERVGCYGPDGVALHELWDFARMHATRLRKAGNSAGEDGARAAAAAAAAAEGTDQAHELCRWRLSGPSLLHVPLCLVLRVHSCAANSSTAASMGRPPGVC
jgi:hypothetical protein|eukprot:SAG25_NODE_1244_length_3512_cov_2.428069_3_plen_127_part_00